MLAGVLADRLSRRRILIAANVLRFGALASIPLAAYFDALTITQLYVVALISGIGSVFFSITYQSYLPSLIPTSQLTSANATLEFSNSGSQIVGSAIGGALVQWFGAALAIALDAVSYLASIVTLAMIRTKEEPRDSPPLSVKQIAIEMREGAVCALGSNDLRCIVSATTTANFGSAIGSSMSLLYAYRMLHLQPGVLGVALGFAAFGFVGALLSVRICKLLGLRTTLLASLLVLGFGQASILLAQIGLPYVVMFASCAIGSVVGTIYNVNQVSYRQGFVALCLQGRVNAAIRTIAWGIAPVGSLVGGLLGEFAGIRPTIAIGAVIAAAGTLWLLPMHEREPVLKTAKA